MARVPFCSTRRFLWHMSVALFHRTTIGDARRIAKHGFSDLKWSFSHEDADAGEVRKAVGVWLSDRPLAAEEGPGGDAVLEVTLELEEAALEPFAVDGVLWDARLWVVPAAFINSRATVRILEVDPRTSWWHERAADEADDTTA